jgi:hypothetical protein
MSDKKALKEAKKAARTEALLAKKAEREKAANGDAVEVRVARCCCVVRG